MKKLLLFIMFLSVLTLSGCKTLKLERALGALEKENYTVDMNMDMHMTIYGSGVTTQTQKASITSKMEVDQTKSYTVSTSEGKTSYSYVEVEGEKVKVYTSTGSTWKLEDVVDVDDYSNQMLDMIDVDYDTDDCFSRQGDVWVGDVEKFTEILGEAMTELMKDSYGSAVIIENAEVLKYDITLDGNKVSLIDIKMTIKMSMYGVSVIVTMSMPMNFSLIGETEVTVPDGLPELIE